MSVTSQSGGKGKRGNYKEVIAMIYNPIFEEEVERKVELKQLKKEIKKRVRQENINQVVTRVYNLLKRKPVLTIAAFFHPLTNMFKLSKDEESIISKT